MLYDIALHNDVSAQFTKKIFQRLSSQKGVSVSRKGQHTSFASNECLRPNHIPDTVADEYYCGSELFFSVAGDI
jgi:hypothetical protein